jgi:hypothetical protein
MVCLIKKPYQDVERDLIKAIAECEAQEKPNRKAIAKKHNVPYDTFLRRLAGGNSKSTRPRTNQRLNEAEEQLLIQYIRRLDSLGIGCPVAKVESTAWQILCIRGGNKEQPLGPKWAKNWRARAMQELGLFTIK